MSENARKLSAIVLKNYFINGNHNELKTKDEKAADVSLVCVSSSVLAHYGVSTWNCG